MKKLTVFCAAIALSVSSAFADNKADSAYVEGWAESPVWILGDKADAVTLNAIPRQAITADDSIATFDVSGAIFDDEWDKISGNGNAISSVLGLAASAKGPSDFTGAFKVLYDEFNMYILLQYTDDDVTGNETVEIMWAPYFKLFAPKFTKPAANYARFGQFGSYKTTFITSTFKNAFFLTPSKAAFTINWGGTTPDLTANLFVENFTIPGTNTVKQIYTIGYAALTGDARPDFNPAIWRACNEGKGISFDLKVNDVDADDALNTDATPVAKPAEYWWNAKDNQGYLLTIHNGFLAPKKLNTGIPQTRSFTSIFGRTTKEQILLNAPANVVVFNSIGKQVIRLSNVDNVNLSTLGKGIYVVRANNQTKKIVR